MAETAQDGDIDDSADGAAYKGKVAESISDGFFNHFICRLMSW